VLGEGEPLDPLAKENKEWWARKASANNLLAENSGVKV